MRLRGIPASDSQSLMIAHLHVGEDSIVSHGTAARLWGIAGFRLDPIHLAIERNHHCEFGLGPIRVHHATVVPDWCRKLVRGIPVVSPGLAIYQLAGTISPERVARALDNAWSLRLVNGRTIDDLLERLGRSGRNGTVVLRELRHVRPDDWVPPASNIESRFDSIMQRAGIRAFRRQVDIGDEEWSGRVDFLADDCPLIVEILSERYHTSLTDARADAERRTRHQSMGYTVVEVWDWEIFQQPWAVVARVQEARNRLLSDV
jgi:very-short-patch-repair endonuclease